jgi:methylated-DNA-[protein]-cysteine S-methyltransferase
MREALHHPILCETEHQLTEYFNGKRTTFELPIHLRGTPFQKRVWQQLLRIPYGCTRSYGHLAVAIGNGFASRAVGLANSKNPLSIIVPCHRVIGASGKLTGFAGGLEIKERLLKLEGARGRASEF